MDHYYGSGGGVRCPWFPCPVNINVFRLSIRVIEHCVNASSKSVQSRTRKFVCTPSPITRQHYGRWCISGGRSKSDNLNSFATCFAEFDNARWNRRSNGRGVHKVMAVLFKFVVFCILKILLYWNARGVDTFKLCIVFSLIFIAVQIYNYV